MHHIVLYGCWGVEQEHLVNNNKTEGVCFTDEMPEFFDSCRAVIHAWAVGGSVSLNDHYVFIWHSANAHVLQYPELLSHESS